MKSDGEIVQLPEGMTPGDIKAGGYVAIPPALVKSVTFLTNPQRRKWRELVQGGMDPADALVKAQER
jgi:hypothetical protein